MPIGEVAGPVRRVRKEHALSRVDRPTAGALRASRRASYTWIRRKQDARYVSVSLRQRRNELVPYVLVHRSAIDPPKPEPPSLLFSLSVHAKLAPTYHTVTPGGDVLQLAPDLQSD